MRDAKILADSVGPHGIRLTTFEITLERPFLAEFNTHRMVSRNSASSRAIPTEQLIERARQTPWIPVFAGRVRGMGVGDVLEDQRAEERAWLASRDAACISAEALLHTDKSRANRLLEPFLYQTIIASATDWDNFFALRDHPGAQPEFRTVARLMREELDESVPEALEWGEWHHPLVDADDINDAAAHEAYGLPKISAGRCARVSWDKHHAEDAPRSAHERWNQLAGFGHWSPGEHPARIPHKHEWESVLNVCDEITKMIQYKVVSEREGTRMIRAVRYWGNFHGWIQLRKHYDGEDVFNG